jgi:hypothetical protein
MSNMEKRLERLELHVTEITSKDKENLATQQPATVASDASSKTCDNATNQELQMRLISNQYTWPPDPSAFNSH